MNIFKTCKIYVSFLLNLGDASIDLGVKNYGSFGSTFKCGESTWCSHQKHRTT